MKTLDQDWVIHDLYEAEIPLYRFLAYLQSAYTDLDQNILFPAWEDSYSKYTWLKNTGNLVEGYNKLITGEVRLFDTVNFSVIRDQPEFQGKSEMQIIKERISWAAPLMRKLCKNADSLRSEMLKEIDFDLLGLQVNNNSEGLLLAQNEGDPTIWSWYCRSSVLTGEKTYTSIRTRFIGKYLYSLTGGFAQIRGESLKACGIEGNLINTWVISSKHMLPVFSTLKPLGVFQLAKELGT